MRGGALPEMDVARPSSQGLPFANQLFPVQNGRRCKESKAHSSSLLFQFLVGPVRACLRRGLTSEVDACEPSVLSVSTGFKPPDVSPFVTCRVHTIPLASGRASGCCSRRGHPEANHRGEGSQPSIRAVPEETLRHRLQSLAWLRP